MSINFMNNGAKVGFQAGVVNGDITVVGGEAVVDGDGDGDGEQAED